jgi:hypothetical protein
VGQDGILRPVVNRPVADEQTWSKSADAIGAQDAILPRIAASRKQCWRSPNGVRCWVLKSQRGTKGETPCNSLSPNTRKIFKA